MKGAAKYLNSKAGGGGIAGRKLVVDFIDSHLNANDSPQRRHHRVPERLRDGGHVRAVPAATSRTRSTAPTRPARPPGIPDLGGVATGVPQACSPVAFPVSPAAAGVQHEGREPADLQRQPVRLQVPAEDSTRAACTARCIFGNDTKDAAARRRGAHRDRDQRRASSPTRRSASSGRDPQSAYTPIVNQMKNDGSNYCVRRVVGAERDPAAQRGAAPGARRTRHRVGVHDRLLRPGVSKDQADVMEGQYSRLDVPALRGGVDQQDPRRLREVRREGQRQRLRGLRLDRDPGVQAGGRRDRQEGRRSTVSPAPTCSAPVSTGSPASTPVA